MSKLKKLGFVVSAVLISGVMCFGADWFVDRNSPGTYDGQTLMTAFLTIQEGIDAASSGDTVWVNDGIYEGTGNVDLDFKGKAITVSSIKGAHLTIIDCMNNAAAVVFATGEGNDSVFKGFTLFQAGGADGAVVITGTSPTVSDNVIRNCNTVNGGISCTSGTPVLTRNQIFDCSGQTAGGIYLDQCSAAAFEVSCNIIHHCDSAADGGAVTVIDSTPLLINNTFADNTAQGAGGGIRVQGSTIEVVNTILWNNTASTGPAGSLDLTASVPSVVDLDYCDVEGGSGSFDVVVGCTLNYGAANIDADPLFLDTAADDYHIPFDSPCRKTGAKHASLPGYDFEGDEIIGLFVLPEIGADEFATHFYVRGRIATGNTVDIVFIGWPNTAPVVLLRSKWIARDPMPTPYGDYLLGGKILNEEHFNPIPANGIRVVTRTVASTLDPGTDLPMQVLIGTELSNLWVGRFEP